MASRSEADYLTRASEIPNEDGLFGHFSKEFSPFPSFTSPSASADTISLSDGTTNSRFYHYPVHNPQSNAMSTLHASLQWTGAPDCTTMYQFSVPQQEIFRTTDGAYHRPDSNGKSLPDTPWGGGSLYHPRFSFASTACAQDDAHKVNEDTNALVGPTSQQLLQSHYRTSPAYHLEPVKQESTSSIYPSRYHPLSSGLYGSSVEMDTLYQPYDHLQNPSSLAIDRDLSGIHTERYATTSPEIPRQSVSAMASTANNDQDTDGALSSEPYAQLIFRALKSVPGHRMVLKEIYEWFEKNTDKAKDNSLKGWQNSIRHNLSMNGAFRKVDVLPTSDEGKKGCIWVLDQKALENGVESTTRYRKVGAHKRVGRTEPVAAQRQRSGARGGKAAKKSARSRRTAHFEEPQRGPLPEEELVPEAPPASMFYEDYPPADEMDMHDLSVLPYFLDTPSTTKHSSIADTHPYGFEDITGVASGLETEPLFCNSNEKLGLDQTLFGISLYGSETYASGHGLDPIS